MLAEDVLPKTGNFSLKTSQQPGSLVSIGQTILDKNQGQINIILQSPQFEGGYNTTIAPNFTYGLTSEFALQIAVPVILQAKRFNTRSSGLSDLQLQLEYAYYNHDTKQFSEQGTLLGQLSFPTGSTEKQPPTGLGAMSLLLGTTFSRTYEKWVAFFCSGVTLLDSYHASNSGNQYLYEFGIGRNIDSRPSKWIFAWLIELDGQYSTANTVDFLRDENSGGNVIYVTPSLWFSTPVLILQTGLGYAVSQNLLGEQRKNTYLWIMDFSLTFG